MGTVIACTDVYEKETVHPGRIPAYSGNCYRRRGDALPIVGKVGPKGIG